MIRSRALFYILITALVIVNAAVLFYLVIQVKSLKDQKPYARSECPAFEDHMAMVLKLTPEQQDSFRLIRQNHLERMRPVRDSMREIRKYMAAELVSENPDPARLDSVADVLGDWHAKVRKLYISHFFEFKSLCNPEQQKILGKLYRDVICCDEPHGDRKCHPAKNPCGKKHKPHKACMN